MKRKIQEKSKIFFNDIVDIRRYIHKHPNLSFNEFETAKFICEQLDKIGVSYKPNIVENGIVALIEGNNKESKVIVLRADMDALPIEEENACDYKSIHKGVMHACGHDVHVASLLGTIKILHELRYEFNGTIKFIFQPAEEKFPGGAKALIDAGVLDNPKVQLILGQHVMPQVEVGKIGIRSGIIMASADEIYFKIIGKGGHAATPELTINPVPVAARIITELMDYVEQHKPMDTPSILSFGKFIADGAMNVVPSEVNIAGTFRAFNEEWRDEVLQIIEKTSKEIALTNNVVCDTTIHKGYPFTINNEELTSRVRANAIAYLGADNVVETDIRLTSEDFAYYAQRVPACFYRLGIRNELKGITANLHTSNFEVDESCLITGMGLMAWLAIKELEE